MKHTHERSNAAAAGHRRTGGVDTNELGSVNAQFSGIKNLYVMLQWMAMMRLLIGLWIVVGLLALVCRGDATIGATTTRPVDLTMGSTYLRAMPTPGHLPGVGNFARVSAVLYRGEQPTAEGFAELKKLGVKTIIDLRTFHDDRPLLKGSGLRYARIYAKPWHPEDEDLAAFLKIVNDPANQPVFVHCQQGCDRTGCAVAVYRMLDQQWTLAQAIDEMRTFGFHAIWFDIPIYLKALDMKTLQERMARSPQPRVEVVN
jgi:protein tyrosine phosphatase (PTP) superfamily phosphohydrolase (DUF442 family)